MCAQSCPSLLKGRFDPGSNPGILPISLLTPNTNIAARLSSNSNSFGIVIVIRASMHCMLCVLPSVSTISHETLPLKLNLPKVMQ